FAGQKMHAKKLTRTQPPLVSVVNGIPRLFNLAKKKKNLVTECINMQQNSVSSSKIVEAFKETFLWMHAKQGRA
ncbi:hypothetical protein M8C21_031364, partial [Ambrosia artemisiifolia]